MLGAVVVVVGVSVVVDVATRVAIALDISVACCAEYLFRFKLHTPD